jgi:hypothetical protein
MKRFLFFLVLVCTVQAIHAQYIYTIKADSVKITNSCDTAELIIENHTQTVPGFLFNKGRGRTEFRRVLQKISDTLVTIGLDTLRIPYAWIQGGNRWNTTGVFGTLDNNPVDFYTNNTRQGRWTNTGNLLLGSITDTSGYKLNVNGMLRAGLNSVIGAPDDQGIIGNETGLKVIGNFQVVTAKTENANGGFKVYWNGWGRPGATAMTLNNFQVLAYDGQMHFGAPNSKFFWVNAAANANLYGGPVTRTKYTIGSSSDPGGWNDSYALFGISNENEFNNDNNYPSGSNFYMLETRLNGPKVATNTGQLGVRAPLRLGGRELSFYTGNNAPGEKAARITAVGNFLLGNIGDERGDKFQLAGDFYQYDGGIAHFGNRIYFDSYDGKSRIIASSEILYQSNNFGDQHLFRNDVGTAFTGTLVTIDPGSYPGLIDGQLALKVLSKLQHPALSVNMAGRVGIGNLAPTAQLHVTGTVRVEGLTNNNSLSRIIVSDEDGNLYYKDASSAFNGTMNSDLAVNGTVSAQKMLISQTGRWPDYVFNKQYQLPSLSEVENFINQNNHLPGVPSAAEVAKKGVDVADNQVVLLKKIEELTLYVIELEKRSQKQSEEIRELKKVIQKNK